jgi:hypothetical membrane protein
MRRNPLPLAQAAVVCIVAYVAIDVALVFLRPQFSVLHSAESDYGSKGAYAWVMDLNFLLRGLLSLTVVYALVLVVPNGKRLTIGLFAIGIWAITSGLLAFFPDDPAGTTQELHGKIHVALAGIAFLAVVIGTRVTSSALRREAAWRPVSTWLTVLSWGAIVPILLLGKAHLRPHSLGGLYEKIFLAVELAWLLVAAVWTIRLSDPT